MVGLKPPPIEIPYLCLSSPPAPKKTLTYIISYKSNTLLYRVMAEVRWRVLCHIIQSSSNKLASSLGESVAEIRLRAYMWMLPCSGTGSISTWTKTDWKRATMTPILRCQTRSLFHFRNNETFFISIPVLWC